MSTSAIIKDNVLHFISDGKEYSIREMKNYLSNEKNITYTEGQFSGVIDNLVKGKKILKVSRGVYRMPNDNEIEAMERGEFNTKKCFVISPIGEEGTDIRKRADQLFQHIIKPVCEKSGFRAVRVDHLNTAGCITQEILDALNKYDLVIADLTGSNPNVFYEVGYRTRNNKPIIHLKQKGEQIPFDVSTIRTFEYDLTDLDIVSSTKDRLFNVIKQFNYDNLEDSKVNAKTDNNMIVSSLNDIQHKLEVLTDEIRKKDNDALKTVVETYSNKKNEAQNMETEMMKFLMPELLRNPDSFDTLIKLSEKLK